jgi:plasmanylethanolamine desaturase
MNAAVLPRHDEVGEGQRAVELASIVAAGSMLLWQGTRLAVTLGPSDAWLVLIVGAAFVSADVVSGVVHWAADTWGSETLPVVGPRFLRPFRVHHVNPADFMRRDFIDTNGDVSLLVLLPLVAAALLPIEGGAAMALATGLVSFAAAGWMTNQVHQWAHVDRPPRVVSWLQRYGILLSTAAHGQHHRPPYSNHYCIATGWMNRPLAAMGFFARLESLITYCTGMVPRRDDCEFAARAAR